MNFLYFFLKKLLWKSFSYFLKKASHPLIFRKPNFLTFRERYIWSPGIFRTLVYSEFEAYSEHCQTSTLKRFCKNSYLAHFLASALNIFLWKSFLYFFLKKPDLKKFLILSGNGTFLYFGRGLFRTQAYLELEAYLNPWYI